MNAFDTSGPSTIGKELQKSAKHRVQCTEASQKRREQQANDPGTTEFKGTIKNRRPYKEMRLKK